LKDYPQNTQQWADEAYQTLHDGWDQLTQNNPFPSETQKQNLVEIAVNMACDNREIDDAKFIQYAQDYAKESFLSDYNSRDLMTEINYSLCFILAYFDAHISLSMITEALANEVISHIRNNYDLTYAGKNQTNVLSINYSKKM